MSDSSSLKADPGPPLWQAAPAVHFDWAQWDGEHVLFHHPSGKTHFVNASTAQLLQSILTVPRTVDAAISVLAPEAGAEEFAELRERITEQLQLLEDLGLVLVS